MADADSVTDPLGVGADALGVADADADGVGVNDADDVGVILSVASYGLLAVTEAVNVIQSDSLNTAGTPETAFGSVVQPAKDVNGQS